MLAETLWYVSSVAVYCVAVCLILNVYMLCVQEVAKLKEEDLTVAPPTANGDPSSVLSESQYTHVHNNANCSM